MEATSRLEQKYTEMSQLSGVYGMVGIFFLRLYGTPMYKMRLKAPNHKHKQLNCPINN